MGNCSNYPTAPGGSLFVQFFRGLPSDESNVFHERKYTLASVLHRVYDRPSAGGRAIPNGNQGTTTWIGSRGAGKSPQSIDCARLYGKRWKRGCCFRRGWKSLNFWPKTPRGC